MEEVEEETEKYDKQIMKKYKYPLQTARKLIIPAPQTINWSDIPYVKVHVTP